MPTEGRPSTPHPVTDTILIGKKLVKTKTPHPKPSDCQAVIEEVPQKISQ